MRATWKAGCVKGFHSSSTRMDQKRVLLFEIPMLLKFKIPLIYMAEGSGIRGHMIRDICTEGAQLWQFKWGPT